MINNRSVSSSRIGANGKFICNSQHDLPPQPVICKVISNSSETPANTNKPLALYIFFKSQASVENKTEFVSPLTLLLIDQTIDFSYSIYNNPAVI